MGVNYTNVTYDTSYPTHPAIHLSSFDGDHTVAGLTVDVSLIGPSGWTPTHYKLWNIDGVTTSGAASWETFSPTVSGATVTGTLIEQSGKQYVYGYFKDSTHESSMVTSNGITFSWTDPTIHSSEAWEDVFSDFKYESKSSATLSNATYNIDIELNKDNVQNLHFSGKDFSDLQVSDNKITCLSSGYLGSLLGIDTNNKISVTKVFATDDTPMITVDTGSGFVTLTAHDGTIRTDVSGDYTGRVDNISWNSGTKTLTFDIYKFSTYGFCTVKNVEFTGDSQASGYKNESIYLKVYVTDTNGDIVEDAPVTFVRTGTDLGDFVSNPVNTNSAGIATAELQLDTVGNCTYDAYVDSVHTDDDQYTWCIDYPANIGRSLLRQLEQVRRTGTYDDVIANVNTSAVAEPVTTSGSSTRLEHDGNVLRTILLQLKGGTNWYDDPGKYFDPTNTDNVDVDNKQMSLANIKGKTLDSQTILLAVDEDNSGAGFTVSGTDTGVLASITTDYALDTDRRGLPIFNSVTNSGSYHDEGASDDVCGIDVIDTSTGGEFKNASGHLVYAKFHDGADNSGSGSGTDVYFKFYANDAEYTLISGDPTNIMFVYPQRKVLDELNEYDWLRTDFVSSFEGDDELIEDISNLWAFTGATDNDSDAGPFDHETNNYPLSTGPSDLKTAIDDLNDAIDDMTFTEDNYIADGDTVADALDKLDQQIKDNADAVSSALAEIYVEELSSDVTAGIEHALPSSQTYTPDSTSGQEGMNMDVFVDGQLLAASTGSAGVNEDRDYAETTTSGITFHMNVYQYSNVTYKIRN